ncbi:MAG TPA: hypothetical protein VMW58_15405 [Anaerolineae bacterium]|nr:hypothetical protein [Anaerolineae bacterium]
MKEWQKELRQELESGLVAYTEDGQEIPVRLDFDSQDGTLRLEWEDGENQQWHLTIPYTTIMALMDAMVKRLYPSARTRRRKKAQ